MYMEVGLGQRRMLGVLLSYSLCHSIEQMSRWWPPILRNTFPSPSGAGVTDLCVILPRLLWGFWVLELRYSCLYPEPFFNPRREIFISEKC